MANKPTFHVSEATRESIFLRVGLCGPSGSGKTKTGLILATRMIEQMGLGPLFVIDSENRSALRYARSPRSGEGFRFKHLPMPEDDYSPQTYMAAMDHCEQQGAGVVLIDSLTHAWTGINGTLEQVDTLTEKSRSKNAFGEGWRHMTPIQNKLIQHINGLGAHVIFTTRAKVEWSLEKNDRGKVEPVKIGHAPVQREGLDYEPDLWMDMTVPKNIGVIGKSRIDKIAIGESFLKPGVEFADIIIDWLKDAEPAKEARGYGEALSLLVTAGLTGAASKDKETWKRAESEFGRWCQSHGVAEQRFLDGVKEASRRVKERMAAGATAPAAPPSDPAPARPASSPASTVDADEERRRRIDLGME